MQHAYISEGHETSMAVFSYLNTMCMADMAYSVFNFIFTPFIKRFKSHSVPVCLFCSRLDGCYFSSFISYFFKILIEV